MGATIRRATAADAPKWLELVQATLGDQYPVKAVYDPAWTASQLDADKGHETWVAEVDGRLNGSISILKAGGPNSNPVANLGRNLFRPESVKDGSAEMLLRAVTDQSAQRNELAIVRIAGTDNAQQILFENLGYVCVGFQPLKHMLQNRMGILFYVRGANSILVTRTPLSESLPQVSELGAAVLEKLQDFQSRSRARWHKRLSVAMRFKSAGRDDGGIHACAPRRKSPIRRPKCRAASITDWASCACREIPR